MARQIAIQPTGPLETSIRPPGSKSITNRALVCAALAHGSSSLDGALFSEDTRVMFDCLRRLGIGLVADESCSTIQVAGRGGKFGVSGADLFVGNSGTTIRFLSAMTSLGRGEFRLDGVPRMRQRPIGDLIDALRQLGVDARSQDGNNCPPVIVHADGLRGGTARIHGNISSQFVSGLLMAAPYAAADVELIVDGPLVSKPYVDMTIGVMEAFGATVAVPASNHFQVTSGSQYAARDYAIEPDASAASYFWGAAAITSGRIKVNGLTRQSLQGDVRFCECLARMGCQVDEQPDGITVRGGPLRGIDADMNDISDTVQTLASVALFASGPTTITGVSHVRHKETDRIGDLARELRKLGATVDELPDGLRITPGTLHGAEIDTYQDHRMAMSLSLVGLRIPGIVIRDPDCTAKTYPDFFRDLESIRGHGGN